MNPRAFLHDDDIVLYAAPTPEAIRSAAVELYHRAQTVARARGPERIDADGEVHARRWRFTFAEVVEDITVKQRGFFHAAVLPQIANQAQVGGQRYTQEAWKEHFRREFLGWRWERVHLPGAKRPTVRKVRVSTEDLSIKQYSEHIDRVIAFATTDLGVEFVFDLKEREAVRYVKPKRKAKTPETEEATA